MDLRDVLRHLQATSNISAISRATGLNRRTVYRYRAWAQSQGLLEPGRVLPPIEELQPLAHTLDPPAPPPQTVSSLEPYRELVVQLHSEGVEGVAMLQRLRERGFGGSLSSLYRFLHRLQPPTPKLTVRLEREPGSEAQVDFGYAGRLIDQTTGELRKAWAFVMLLSYSRHLYVEFVFDQRLPTWIALHAHAFAFFGGVPSRVVLDNLKAGITCACFDDPQVQPTYRECAEHYGFLLAPCAPRTPEHKGKVEQGGVHYVKRNFLGGRPPSTREQANADVLAWCATTAGTRTHGTTKQAPLQRFAQVERARLKPLPAEPYDLAIWKQVKLHRDGYVVFEQAFYSAPFRLVGQQLWVRGGVHEVRLYTSDYALVATHARAQRPGERLTHPDHLPPEKLAQATWTRATCHALAAEVGLATSRLIQTLLDDPVVDRHPRAVRVLKLRERVGAARLEAACARALHFGDLTYATLRRILERGLEQECLADLEVAPHPREANEAAGSGASAVPTLASAAGRSVPARTFGRSASELLGHLFHGLGGQGWN